MNLNILSNSNKDNNYLYKKKQDKNSVSFQGAESFANAVFTQIQTNKIIEATAVDAISMIIPRTAIDFTRSPDAGRETLFRESSGTVINCLAPGILATGIGFMLGKFIKPDIKVNTALPTDSSTVELLKNAWNETNPADKNYLSQGADKKQCVQSYIEHVFQNTEGLAGKEWVKLDTKSDEVKKITGDMADLILNPEKTSSKSLKGIKDRIVTTLGASENIRITGKKPLSTTVERIVRDLHDTGKEIFTAIEPGKLDSAIDKMTKTSGTKAVITLSVITVLAFAQQFVNRYLTKKRTGKDGFVGISEDSREPAKPDKSSKTKLNIAKVISVAAIFSIAAATIANSVNPKKIIEALKPKELVKKLEFNGMWPHLNQLRAVYVFMIAGRMLASADKHELRETDTRDIPGFLNWLVIGGFVSKGIGKLISKKDSILNSATSLKKDATRADKIMHFFGSESLKSHAEIDAIKGLSDAGKKALKTKLNIAIFAGLAYSTLALGLIMPMLNKHITKKLTSKEKQPEDSNIKTVSLNDKVNTMTLNNQTNAKNNEAFFRYYQNKSKA